MSKSIIGNVTPSQLSAPPPAETKTVVKKRESPKITTKPAKDVVVTPDGRRFRGGLELGREPESDEEKKTEALSTAVQKSPDAGNKKHQKKENAVAITTSTQTETQPTTSKINSPEHNFENDYDRLESAIEAGNIHIVKQLISKEIKKSSGYLHHLLSSAIRTEDSKIIEHIIESTPSISLELELNSNLLLKLVNLGRPKLIELFLNKLDRTVLDSESFKNTAIADWTGSVLDHAALMAASAGHSEILGLLIKAGAELKRPDLDQAINDTRQFLKLVLNNAVTESASEEFSDCIGRTTLMDYFAKKPFIDSLKQYASAFAVIGQDGDELTAQQLKMIFLQCVISSDPLHKLINAKEQNKGFEKYYIRDGFSTAHLNSGLKAAWQTNLLMNAAQLESDREKQLLEKFLTQLSPSVKTAQLREAAGSAGWHPMVIKMLTDVWTSLARRKTKDNFFAAINVRLNTSEWFKKIMALESDAARHIITLQLDKLKDWINSPSGNNIVTTPTAQTSDQT